MRLWHLSPLASLLALLLIGVLMRVRRHARNYGNSGVALFRTGDLIQTLRELSLVVFAGLVTVEATAPVIRPSALVLSERARLVAVGLVCAGLLMMWIAQGQMGPSWRIGIDLLERPGLVERGLYRFCRNPIYVAMLIWLIGFTILVPNWLSIAALVAVGVGLRQQILFEEAYLARCYPDEFALYASRVGRFLPWWGRLHPVKVGIEEQARPA